MILNDIIFPDTGKDQEYRQLVKGPDKPKWSMAMDNEIGQLFQGTIYIYVTDTCFFIHRYKVTKNIKITY